MIKRKPLITFFFFGLILVCLPILGIKAFYLQEEKKQKLIFAENYSRDHVLGDECDTGERSDIDCSGNVDLIDFTYWLENYRQALIATPTPACSGCLLNGECYPGNTSDKCGKDGANCESCIASAICQDGVCVLNQCSTDSDCSDNNPCTEDTCLASGVCIYPNSPDETACGESGETCQNGVCVELTPAVPECDVGDKDCGGSNNRPRICGQNGEWDLLAPCGSGYFCQNGVCVPGTQCQTDSDCSDNNPCTEDTCDNELCSYSGLADGTVCGTNMYCQSGVAACAASFGNCDANPDNGCETSLTTIDHCQSCENVCSATNECKIAVCEDSGCGEENKPNHTPCSIGQCWNGYCSSMGGD